MRSLDAVVTSDLPPVVDGVQAVSGARHWLGEAFQELRAAREEAAGKAPDM